MFMQKTLPESGQRFFVESNAGGGCSLFHDFCSADAVGSGCLHHVDAGCET